MNEYSINAEDYEKLKFKVADMEEQYLKEKQIIIGYLTIHTDERLPYSSKFLRAVNFANFLIFKDS